MRPRLQRRLVLERRIDTSDGGGGVHVGWIAVSPVWADVRPIAPRERRVGAALGSRVSHRLLLRQVPEESACHPRPTDRLREGGRIFVIHGQAQGPEGFLTIWADEEATP